MSFWICWKVWTDGPVTLWTVKTGIPVSWPIGYANRRCQRVNFCLRKRPFCILRKNVLKCLSEFRLLRLCPIYPLLVGILSWLPFSLNFWCHILNAGHWLGLHWSQFVQVLWQSKWTARSVGFWCWWYHDMYHRLWWYLCLEIQPIKSLDELFWDWISFTTEDTLPYIGPVYYQLITLWYRAIIKNVGVWNFGLRIICQF